MSCSPRFFSIRFIKGDTYPLYITVLDDAGAAINITGCKVIMVAKTTETAPDSAAIFNISTTGGDIILTNAAQGEMCVTIPSSATLDKPEALFPCFYNVVVEIGPPYTSSLGFSGFSGLSGLGLYRNTVVKGTITLIPNALDT